MPLSPSKRTAAYTEDEASREDIQDAVQTKVKATQIRNDVRSIQVHPVLSEEWLQLTEVLHRLARVCQTDLLKPTDSTNIQDCVGRDGEDGGTLWDQDSDEEVIRILVEECKINTCLRMLMDYKSWQYRPHERLERLSAAIATTSFDALELEAKAVNVEYSLGLLLNRCCHHLEAMQLTDLACLIDHCAFCLRQCECSGWEAPLSPKAQETLVMLYFASAMFHAEKLNSDLLMQKCQESNLIHLVVRQSLRSSDQLPAYALAKVCSGLSCLADNEDFQSNWKDFFRDESDGCDKKSFFEFEEKVVREVLVDYPEKKRDLRPLLDFIATLRRSA